MVRTRGTRILVVAVGTIGAACVMPMQANAQEGCDWCRECGEDEIEILESSSPDAVAIAEAIGGEGCFFNQDGCDSALPCGNEDADLSPELTLDTDALTQFRALLSNEDVVGLRRFADDYAASLQLIPHRALLAFKAPCGIVFAIKQLTPLQASMFVSTQAVFQRADAGGEEPGVGPSTP